MLLAFDVINIGFDMGYKHWMHRFFSLHIWGFFYFLSLGRLGLTETDELPVDFLRRYTLIALRRLRLANHLIVDG